MGAEFDRLDRAAAGHLVVTLLMPKLKKYVRQRRTYDHLNPLSMLNKFWHVETFVKEFFDLPQNAAAKKAFESTPYAKNLSLLAKRISKDV